MEMLCCDRVLLRGYFKLLMVKIVVNFDYNLFLDLFFQFLNTIALFIVEKRCHFGMDQHHDFVARVIEGFPPD